MKKDCKTRGWYVPGIWHQMRKILMTMKLSLLILLLSLSSAGASVYSQNSKLNLDYKNVSVKEVLGAIEDQSEFRFAFSSEYLELNRKVSVRFENESVTTVLDNIFKETNISYSIKGRVVILSNNERIGNRTLQQKTISGKVTDSSGVPLPGVTVVVKGTIQGIITDNNGDYSLSSIPADATLVFSFVGMKTQEISVAGKSAINVTMEENAIGIEEVVAVGYGTQKKRDIIGSISSVKSDVIESSSGVSNFTSLLQGQAAGASVQTTSGRLGAGVDVKIRGLSSISAGTSPLWVIDGIPITADVNTGAEYTAGQSAMSLINQADIESIDILKDAAATSIYGSRGSNGVILITTKSGVMGKFSVNLDYSAGVSDLPFQQVDFVNTKQWFEMKDAMKKSYGLGKYDMSDYYSGSSYVTEYLTREQAETMNFDWRKEAMRKGSFQNINFSVVGGDQKARYFVSANYRKDKGVMLNDDLERYGLRANVDIKPSENFKTGAKLNFSSSNSSRGKNYSDSSNSGNKSANSGGFSILNTSTSPFNPVYSLVNPKEYFNPYMGNPVALSDPDNLVQDFTIYRTLAHLYGEYTFPFLKELSVRTELSLDFAQANRNTWVSKEIRWDGSLGQDVARTSRSFNYNLFFTYDNTFGDHNLNMVGGAEAQRSSSWYRSMEGQGLVGSYQQLGTPSQLVSMQSKLIGEAYLLAYFGRANYKYKDKYLAGISVRRDGSSVFTDDYRWGTFAAFSAGWIFSEEPFMDNFGDNIFLKLRGSFGQTGNANIPSGLDVSKYDGNSVYGSSDILGNNGTNISSIGVSNLTWETTNSLDFGLDFGFMNNRINGSIAYYNKYVKDLLLASQLPYSSGIGSIYGNIGDLVNSGIEFNIVSLNVGSQRLKWQTSFNISFNHNEVKKLTPQVDQAGTGMVSTIYMSKVGSPVRDYYMADFAGIDTQTGLPMIYTLDADHYNETGETIRLKDAEGKDVLMIDNSANATTNRFHLEDKNQIPAYYGGVTNKFTYKAFDFSFLVTFSGGNYIYDSFMRDNALNLSYSGEILKDVYDNYWKEPGDNAKYQRLNWKGNVKMDDGTFIGLGDPRHNTSQFLFKGDYVKLKSVTLGYTLPEKSAGKKIFQGFRVYATVENLYTITKYPGWDPEGQREILQWDLPQLFSASVGLSIKF